MARYVASVDSHWEREQAFEYLADFATIADWDPGVTGARRLSPEPLAIGARVEVDSSVLGREIPLTYETIELEPPRRVVLLAETSMIVSLDVMTFDLRPGGGTIVTYDADLRLRGPLRVLDVPFRLLFQRLGDGARDGLRRRLAATPPGDGSASS